MLLNGVVGGASWGPRDLSLLAPPRGQCSGCGRSFLSPSHRADLIDFSAFQPINNADFVVPVEIEGTTHQVSCLPGLSQPRGLRSSAPSDLLHQFVSFLQFQPLLYWYLSHSGLYDLKKKKKISLSSPSSCFFFFFCFAAKLCLKSNVTQ